MTDYLKKLFGLLAILFLMIQGCAVSQSKPETVCVTQTGEKYHKCDCRYLSHSSKEITKEEARRRNFGACSVCRPGPLREEVDSVSGDNVGNGLMSPQKEVQRSPKSTQCTALTKAGQRCKRTVASGSAKCWQHQQK